jgi:16S rRNA (guanine527-N7)-methyltransferase
VTLARHQATLGPAGGGETPRLLDLGSGGGLPGLVLAEVWPTCTVVLLDANERRTDFLRRSVTKCGLGDRVSVVHQRAEVAGRDPALRGSFDGVVVRSFGPPAVVAECAAPFLHPGGWLIVSEPPGSAEGAAEEGARWPAGPLAQVGLEPQEFVRTEFGYQVLRQAEACPDRFPRRNGVPTKSPLF